MATLVAASWLVGSRVALAEPAHERTWRIDYAADAACPDEAAFAEAAKKHTARWPTLTADADVHARVRASRAESGFAGEIVLVDAAGGSLGRRTIEAARCDDAVLALAIFLGVAIDAEAAAEIAPPPSPPPPPPPPPPPKAAVAPRHVAPSPPRAAWFASAAGHAYFGRSPRVAPGLSLALEAKLPARSGFAPSFELGIASAPDSAIDFGRGRVHFGWATLFLRACEELASVRARSRGRWEPRACAHAEGGGYRASSTGYAQDRVELVG